MTDAIDGPDDAPNHSEGGLDPVPPAGRPAAGLMPRIREELMRILQGTPSPVIIAYVFGSACDAARFTASSDLDLAFLLDERTWGRDPVSAAAMPHMAGAEVGMILGRKTDVVILNCASVETVYQVVTSGVCLFDADPGKRLEFESVARGKYFDFKPFLDRLRSECIARI